MDHAFLRLEMVKRFYSDILGPSKGVREVLDVDPISRYITGILAPREPYEERNPDSEADIPEKGTEEEIPYSESIGIEDIILHQADQISPMSKPSSMGLSFLIRVGENEYPAIGLAVTWARYLRTGDGRTLWKREPRHFMIDSLELKPGQLTRYVGGEGSIVSAGREAEVGIHIFIRPKKESGLFYVSIFLTNEMKRKKNSPLTEFCVFQPQIRIKVLRGKLEAGMTRTRKDAEERLLDFVFRKRSPRAKGHMCSALWRDVDVETQLLGMEEEFPPFTWRDGSLFDEESARMFIPSDLRTDFVPMVLLEAPDYDWDARWGSPPELKAGILAESWNIDDIDRNLSPLVSGYRKWIARLREELGHQERDIVEFLIKYHEGILRRLEEAIRLIKEDTDVRLSFCFANKVMDLQFKWQQKERQHGEHESEGLVWRPFQLAFLLLAVESLSNPESESRTVCDILFVPTGGGKTEAYLAIAAFALALRRRRALSGLRNNPSGAGLGVMLRYTLRLLSIQQFRRALRMITAMEYLRTWGLKEGGPVGWRPEKCDINQDFIWGTARFSIGLWVGEGVTPNWLLEKGGIKGAVDILRGIRGNGEPAQVLRCPACGSILSIPHSGLKPGSYRIHVTACIESGRLRDRDLQVLQEYSFSEEGFNACVIDVRRMPSENYIIITFRLEGEKVIGRSHVNKMLQNFRKKFGRRFGITITGSLSAPRAYAPGYFIINQEKGGGIPAPWNFAIYCSNPDCDLNKTVWAEGLPKGDEREIRIDNRTIKSPDGYEFVRVPPFARLGNNPLVAARMPIPAQTVDEQIYMMPPSFLVATVDKIARLSFEPMASALFGNVNKFNKIYGFYRSTPDGKSSTLRASNSSLYNEFKSEAFSQSIDVVPFDPPDLIIQDELHLIDGPLGSMVGIYETAVEYLAARNGIPPKYIASSATVKRAEDQVKSIFVREVVRFPYYGSDTTDRFFIRFRKATLKDTELAGRLYIGVAAPGEGGQFPIRRMWAVLLQTAHSLVETHKKLVDPYWTLVAYFNAIRELAGARSVYRQDVAEELKLLGSPGHIRDIEEERVIELSSRVDSISLPSYLEEIEKQFSGDPGNPSCVDVLFTTSMFGTGVDVPRLSLMFVDGQPKTTSAYIQATGRVGRMYPGIVITFYRISRPRDLSHYEMFAGYHLNLERFVEPATSTPFAPSVLERCLGPVAVAILRNRFDSISWIENDDAMRIKDYRNNIRDDILDVFSRRYRGQPDLQKFLSQEDLTDYALSELDRWASIARETDARGRRLLFVEYITVNNSVVLGDPRHRYKQDIDVVYENAPQSLRDIEETISIDTEEEIRSSREIGRVYRRGDRAWRR
jgi:hypothetical protein